MNEKLRALYKTQILTNAQDEIHFKELTSATHVLEAYNPLCGDKYTVYLEIENETIQQASFKGYGCAISKASTNILIKNLIGKTLQEIPPMIDQFMEIINAESNQSPESITEDEELLAFAATHEFPERKKCASLSWEEVGTITRNNLDLGYDI